eukprot:TRINITY_DN54430_c0_g1_i1.p1 TRINITY_DN54430_c0_g1~~TRINITY_DN54430_c0_g1_i1.p1  ORF type:complete len:301 (+),score=45.03 TRINITY_DN54430_c0_g1_i1:70-972(+)
MLPGGWRCQVCGAQNFAPNAICRSCGTPRPAAPLRSGPYDRPRPAVAPQLSASVAPQLPELAELAEFAEFMPGTTSVSAVPQLSVPAGFAGAAAPAAEGVLPQLSAGQALPQLAPPPLAAPQLLPAPHLAAPSQLAAAPPLADFAAQHLAAATQLAPPNLPNPTQLANPGLPGGSLPSTIDWSSLMAYGLQVAQEYQTTLPVVPPAAASSSFSGETPKKPAAAAKELWGSVKQPKPGDWRCQVCRIFMDGRTEACTQCHLAPPQKRRVEPGDWLCPQCQDIQFRRNPKCRKCGLKRINRP